jgi:hypothetical protein
MLPLPAADHRNRLDPVSSRQGSNEDACGYRTKLKNAPGTIFREFLYPWDPWSTLHVAIHEAIRKGPSLPPA